MISSWHWWFQSSKKILSLILDLSPNYFCLQIHFLHLNFLILVLFFFSTPLGGSTSSLLVLFFVGVRENNPRDNYQISRCAKINPREFSILAQAGCVKIYTNRSLRSRFRPLYEKNSVHEKSSLK